MEDNQLNDKTVEKTPHGIGLPAEVMYNPLLSNTEKILFGCIRGLALSSDGCYASNIYLSKCIMNQEQTVSNSLAKLKDLQYITIVYNKKKQTRNIYLNTQLSEIYLPLIRIYYDNFKKDDPKPLLKKLYSAIKKIIEPYKEIYNIYKIDIEKGILKNSFSKEKESRSSERHLSTVEISLETKTKLNRRTEKQIANSKQCLLQKTILSLEQQKRKHLSDGIRQLSQPSLIPEDHLTEEMKAIINHWEGLGLKVSNKATKTHKEGLKKLRRLFGGQLLFDKKYTVDEIQNSITRFSLAVKSKEYEPQDKKWLSAINLDGFIFNKHAKETSQFIKYLNKDEPKLAIQPLKNLYPEIANKLKKRYFHDILGAISPVKLSQKDENNFIYASTRLIDYWIANKQKIYGEFSASEKADLLFDSVKNSAMGDLSIITPGWFCSDKTFSIRLSSWLQQKRITKTGVDSNEYNTNFSHEYIDEEKNNIENVTNCEKEELFCTEEDLADRLRRIKKKIINNNCETHQINL